MRIITFLLFISACLTAQAQPKKLWDKTFGCDTIDVCTAIAPAADGGWLLVGTSNYGFGGDKTATSKGNFDYWAVRIDSSGNKLWDKTYGGRYGDACYAAVATSDGGWLLGGLAVSGIGGDKSEPSRGMQDMWVVRIDADGNKLWDKTYGGAGLDWCNAIAPTADGGWVLAGYSTSDVSGEKSNSSRGGEDFWVVRIDADGNKIWDRTYGGGGDEVCVSVVAAADGGWLLGGWTQSAASGDKTEPSRGSCDMWAVRIDADGNMLWDKTFGGSSWDACQAVVATSDGGWLLGAYSFSDVGGDKSSRNIGQSDFWVVRIDAAGNKVWDRTYGGYKEDYCLAMSQALDGGWLLGGYSESSIGGDKSEPTRGGLDYWVVRIDADGNKLWDKTIGGPDKEYIFTLTATSDGGWLLGGESQSGAGGDKSESSRGGYDMWVVRLGPDHVSASRPNTQAFALYPNPSSDVLHVEAGAPLQGSARILDALGRVVRTQPISGERAEIDVHGLPMGVYVLEVGVTCARFVKE